jgi:hypothetical protein
MSSNIAKIGLSIKRYISYYGVVCFIRQLSHANAQTHSRLEPTVVNKRAGLAKMWKLYYRQKTLSLVYSAPN